MVFEFCICMIFAGACPCSVLTPHWTGLTSLQGRNSLIPAGPEPSFPPPGVSIKVPPILDDDDEDGHDDGADDTLITLIPAGPSILPSSRSIHQSPAHPIRWILKTENEIFCSFSVWMNHTNDYITRYLVGVCVGRFGAIDKILWRLWPGWGFSQQPGREPYCFSILGGNCNLDPIQGT